MNNTEFLISFVFYSLFTCSSWKALSNLMRRQSGRTGMRIPSGIIFRCSMSFILVDTSLPSQRISALISDPEGHRTLQVQIHRHWSLTSAPVQGFMAHPSAKQNFKELLFFLLFGIKYKWLVPSFSIWGKLLRVVRNKPWNFFSIIQFDRHVYFICAYLSLDTGEG